MSEEQLEMFDNPNDKKRIKELEEEVKNLKMAYDRLADMYDQETRSTMETKAVPGENLYTDEVLENGQRKRVPKRKLQDWEEAGVPKEMFDGWDK
jgi:hypothetical protein